MKRYKSKVFLAVLLVALQIFGAVPVQAELFPAMQEIRVGLTSLYSDKETLTIYNSKLGYGYCVNNMYLQEAVLTSSTGFTFVPVNGYFVAESAIYGSYQAACRAVENYRQMGIEAYPGSSYQCIWRVYFGNKAKYAEAETFRNNLVALTGKSAFEVLSGSNYRVKVSGSFGTLLMDVDEHYAYPQFRPLLTSESGIACVDMGKRVYRGRVEIGRYNKSTLTAVNILPLEEYLYGVVASEMPTSWHEEALKAQAVCARSYALIKAGFQNGSNAKKGYKIVDTVSSQVYKGYLAETVKTNKAVDATKGEMVCYDNKVVATYYFSSSGGRTESSKAVWAVEIPYLQSVTDVYEQDTEKMSWVKTMTKQEIMEALLDQGISLGTMEDIYVSKYSPNYRVYALNLIGAKRFTTLQGSAIRTLLNLDSTKFKIVRQGDVPDEVTVLGSDHVKKERISNMYIASADGVAKASEGLEQYIVQSAEDFMNYPGTAPEEEDTFLFAGMGHGHGVGMSQYGAKGMAEAGYTYKEIIEYYFTGANVR